MISINTKLLLETNSMKNSNNSGLICGLIVLGIYKFPIWSGKADVSAGSVYDNFSLGLS